MVVRVSLFAAIVAAAGACLSGCSPSSDLKRETGVELCPSANVQDLTTQEEQDTTPGFSRHLLLSLDPTCARDFERQLSAISPRDCSIELLRNNGCAVMDTYTSSGRHTSIIARPISPDKYDVRFYQ